MIDYPEMYSEIFDSLNDYFANNEDVWADCLLYLSNLNHKDLKIIQNESVKYLKKMDRCINCGNKLTVYTYKQTHSELDGQQYEVMNELICPNCDLPHQTLIKGWN